MRGAAAAAAGVVLGGCDDPSTAGPATPSPSPAPPPPAPQPVDWQQFSRTLRGRVVLPSDGDYRAAKAVFNARYGASKPVAVVIAETVDDVRRAVEFAARSGVQVAPRSGGHSYVGASAASGAMVLDLRQLGASVSYDERSGIATVPAAASLDDVQTALATHGRVIPSGSCPTVGVAGLTLGGGLGADTRGAGLTCDALAAVSVVLADGAQVTADSVDHSDLFWALHGGGGGNFGVATSFSFRTHPAVDRDVVTMRFPDSAVADVLVRWSEFLATEERSTWGMVNVPVGPGAAGCLVVLATRAGAGSDRAAALAAAIGTRPLSTSVRTLARLDFVRYFEGGELASSPRTFVAGSDVIGELNPVAAQSIVAAVQSWPRDGGGATAVIESLTGAVRDLAPGATAFPWRRAAACIQWYSEPSTQEEIGVATAWLADAHRAVAPHSVGGYVNYVEPDTPAARYFGANLDRLASVRQRYDPQRVLGSGLVI